MVIEKPAPPTHSEENHLHSSASPIQPSDVLITKVNDIIDVDQ